MKTTALVAVVLAVVMCAVPAWCQGGPGGPGGPCPAMGIQPTPPASSIDSITTTFSLTTDQATQLKAILTANDTAVQSLMDAAQTADKALQDAVTAADFDSAADLATAASDAHLAITKANIDGWAKIQSSGILTAAQLTQLMTSPVGAPPSDQGNSSQSGSKGGDSQSSSKGGNAQGGSNTTAGRPAGPSARR